MDSGLQDRAVRGNMILPYGTGKVLSELFQIMSIWFLQWWLSRHVTWSLLFYQVVKVAFFAEGAQADEARAAGVDIVGGVELVEEIASN